MRDCKPRIQARQYAKEKEKTYEESAIPANALYQAKNAANNPKYPPAFCDPRRTFPVVSSASKCPIARNKNARSSVKNRRKNATVDLSVQIKRINVKMNQPMRKNPRALLRSFTPAPVAAPVVAFFVA